MGFLEYIHQIKKYQNVLKYLEHDKFILFQSAFFKKIKNLVKKNYKKLQFTKILQVVRLIII